MSKLTMYEDFNNKVKCKECDKLLSENDAIMVDDSDNYNTFYCQDCFENSNNIIICEECEHIFDGDVFTQCHQCNENF